MAAIVRKSDGQILCGATIIDERYALTAAHCINTPGKYASDLELLVGEHDYKNRKIDFFPNYLIQIRSNNQ